MSAAQENNTPVNLSLSFGSQLKNAREQAGLSVGDVSQSLKLTLDKIQKIESADVEALPAATFTCGYLRLYARLVNLDEEQIVESYNKLAGNEPAAIITATSELPDQATSDHPGMKLTTYVLIAAGVVLFILWVNSTNVDDTEIITTSTDVEQATESVESVEQSQVAESDKLTDKPVVSENISGEVATLISEVSESKADAPVDTGNETELVSENETGQSEIIKQAKKASPVAAVGNDVLAINATADCWTEISDQNDHLLYFGLLQNGDSTKLQGQAPFKVFLGDATVINIVLNNNEQNIERFIRSNNTARFELGVTPSPAHQVEQEVEMQSGSAESAIVETDPSSSAVSDAVTDISADVAD